MAFFREMYDHEVWATLISRVTEAGMKKGGWKQGQPPSILTKYSWQPLQLQYRLLKQIPFFPYPL
ncbi:hypothetical protein D6C00_12335 [Thiohalobacter thiocyanaticus]|uniref:Uncharacterized protein n=1 Tax=Thiohalobacter thiocyanaticus TaxID=585455 RepID=A0A426QLP4_9GAMM|nr:hypothetical protein D6C00_12335 [Thiohalobacter thiocyanaticus]